MNIERPHSDETRGEDLNDLMRRRREELEELRAKSVEPYPASFERTDLLAGARKNFSEDGPPAQVAVAGRIMSIRRMGKASFCHILDPTDRMQVYLKQDELGETYDVFKLLDIGDIVGIRGFVFRTRTGELTVHAESLTLLAKSLRPLPVVKEKTDEAGKTVVYDPLSDKEFRYRQRYVDLVVSPQVRTVFVQRAKVISTIRSFFDRRMYLEVETPILQPLYGGAAARPFTTHHNTLGIELFLRIADELYLKRLIVGGFDAVYEISKDFRNEGMDRTHNPEFTMLELYVAYKDYAWMMTLVEELFAEVATALHGKARLTVGPHEIDFTPPFRRLSMFDAIREATGKDLKGKSEAELRSITKELAIELPPAAGVGAIIDGVFSERVEPHLIQPTFITDYPIEMSPLAKNHRSDPCLVERFELIVNGQELCNAFSELNDPLEQRKRFEEQRKLKARGDDAAQPLDEDFLRALEYGMPPTAGLGVGIDRLVMLMTNQDSIRDVIFFPQMKPEA